MKRSDIKWELDPKIKKALTELATIASKLWEDPSDKHSFELTSALDDCVKGMKAMESAKSAIGFHAALTALTKTLQQYQAEFASDPAAKSLHNEATILSKIAQQAYSPPTSPREDQQNKRANIIGQHRYFDKPIPKPNTDAFKMGVLNAKNARAEGHGTTPEQDKILKAAEDLEKIKPSPGRRR